MAKKKTPSKTTKLMIGVIFLLLVGFWHLFRYSKNSYIPFINHSITLTQITPTLSPESELLTTIATWYPSASWTSPQTETRTTTYGKLTGESIHATVTSETASISHFEQIDTLKKMGFAPDIQLNADGPGSSSWGYVRPMHNTSQIILFSYVTTPTGVNPNEPLQFTCPCKISINAFVSKPF